MAIDASEERLSKYELIRPLGSGGMGEVYLARDRVLQRQVAIKFVSSKRLNEPGAERRLVREARAAAALDHPAICPVYDVLGSEDRTCIVMQYVEGETLAARLKRGALDPAAAVTLALRIADALATAHAAGIVHRDLKPQNIVLMPDGRPKLLDFGIAQAQLPADVVASLETHTATDTVRSGAVVGTPAYMSPEQVLRKPVDGRSDLFSLGAVLYECLTGQAAFLAATDVETWARVVYVAAPPPSSIVSAVTPATDEIVAKLLAKDPDQRYASAEAAVVALRAIAGPGTRDRMSARQLALAVGAVVIAVALTGFAAWRLTRPRPLPPAPPEAARWYEIGTDHLRDGAYYSAELAFEEALHVYPEYPQALVRLAESLNELDNEHDARGAIIRASEILPNPARLPSDDSARMLAVRALLARDLSRATAEYRAIVDRSPRDRGTCLDLARVQMAGGLLADAAASSRLALQIDRNYAPAHLRLGAIAAAALRRNDALEEFAEAERLYRAASNVEGQTEVFLERAQFLNAIGDAVHARQSLVSGAALAAETGNQYQQIRARLLLTAITAAAGDLETARQAAQDAVSDALQHGFGVAAADGLRILGTTLMFMKDNEAARTELEKSIDLARKADSKIAIARSQLQLASLYSKIGQPRDALNLANGVLDFLHRGEYRRFELLALNVLSRAHEDLYEYAEAHRLSREVLATAQSMRDDAEVANALENLANQATSAGSLPEALTLRAQQEESHRRQQSARDLAFDLTNRAEVLIRLGRMNEANAPLEEIDAGARAGGESFMARSRKVAQLRALMAAEWGQFGAAETFGRQVIAASAALKEPDTTQFLSAVLLAYAEARLGRRGGAAIPSPPPGQGSRSFQLEFRYWHALAHLAGDNFSAALGEATSTLSEITRAPTDELEWRMAAIGSEAARRSGDLERANALTAQSRAALQRLRDAWKSDAAPYEQRPDLIERKHEIGMD